MTTIYNRSFGPVFINLYTGLPTAEGLRDSLRHQTRQYEERGHKLGVLAVVSSEGFKIDAEARKVAREVTLESGPLTLATALILEREGFVGAAQRSLVSGINMVTQREHPISVFKAPHDAASWLCDHLRAIDQDVDPQELLAEVDRFRSSVSG